MPTLAQATSKTIEQLGYQRVEASAAPQVAAPPSTTNSLTYVRSPTPPIQTNQDSVGMFENVGNIPQGRLLATQPLYAQTNSGGSGGTTIIQGGGGGGSTGSAVIVPASNNTSALTASNTAVTTPPLNQNTPYTTTIALSPAFLLFQVAVSSPARVELYSTAAAQLRDMGRSTTAVLTSNNVEGLIADFSLALPTEAVWLCSPAPAGFNGDTPQSPSVYLTVTNLNATTVPVTVSFLYLPLE